MPDIRLVPVAKITGNPTEIMAPPDGSGRLFLVQQQGRIFILRNGEVLADPFLNWTSKVSCCGERGLLGLAFPPGFPAKGYFYVNYTDTSGNTVVSRLNVSPDPDKADPGSERIILQVVQPYANHNGGHIAFGPDGHLYIGMGDGGSAGDPQGNAQNLNSLLGKMLRIDTESGSAPYSIPTGNPFAGRSGARAEIWAYGLRNPWKFTFDRELHNLYIADVGQGRTEEVNFQPASSTGGENYGWNRTEGTGCYSPSSGCDRNGITMPVAEYSHSMGISVTGGYVYRGAAVPDLRGVYLYGDYGSGRLWGLRNTASGWQNAQLLSTGLQISTFGEDQAGEQYIANYEDGSIYRVASATANLSVVNAASFREGIAPGSLATIFGSGIAPVVGIAQAASFPIPADFHGVSITMNGRPVPIVGIASVNGQDQINIQVPFELVGSDRVTMTVNGPGWAGASVEVPIVPLQPEIFTVVQQPGAWTIWATGLGATTNQPGTGQAAPASPLARTLAQTEVTLDGIRADVFYSGLSPNFAGLYQVNVIPPPGISLTAEVVLRVDQAVSRPWRASAK